jgi:hypothetical protein
MLSFVKFLLAHLFTSVLAATYQRSDSIKGSGFLSEFTAQAIPDPTQGRVLVHYFLRGPIVNASTSSLAIMWIPKLRPAKT